MAEMKPFALTIEAALRIGETEWKRDIQIELPVSMKYDGQRSVGTISCDADAFSKHLADLTDWFAAFPEKPEP